MISEEKATALLQQLVQIPSVNPRDKDEPAEGKVAAAVASWLEAERIGARVKEVLPGRPNVIARVNGLDTSQTVLFESHMDTVEIEGMTVNPFGAEVRDGRLYGRGACDAKGPLAAMMLALSDFAANPPPVNVELIGVIDEEYQYRGVSDLLKDKSDYIGAIVGEPTELQIITANKGSVRFTLTTKGRPCHSSSPWEGDNAIYRMADLLHFIQHEVIPDTERLSHPMVGKATLCVSLIEGGQAVNSVPGSCTIHIDRRTLPGESPMQVWQEYEALFRNYDRDNLIIGTPYIIDYGMDTAQDSLIVAKLRTAVQAAGYPGDILGVNYGADASKIALAGVPSVVFGPGSIAQAHRNDEFIAISQVVAAAKILVNTIRSIK